jgi:hypothetical protein
MTIQILEQFVVEINGTATTFTSRELAQEAIDASAGLIEALATAEQYCDARGIVGKARKQKINVVTDFLLFIDQDAAGTVPAVVTAPVKTAPVTEPVVVSDPVEPVAEPVVDPVEPVVVPEPTLKEAVKVDVVLDTGDDDDWMSV